MSLTIENYQALQAESIPTLLSTWQTELHAPAMHEVLITVYHGHDEP